MTVKGLARLRGPPQNSELLKVVEAAGISTEVGVQCFSARKPSQVGFGSEIQGINTSLEIETYKADSPRHDLVAFAYLPR